jgi:hypothetical protein
VLFFLHAATTEHYYPKDNQYYPDHHPALDTAPHLSIKQFLLENNMVLAIPSCIALCQLFFLPPFDNAIVQYSRASQKEFRWWLLSMNNSSFPFRTRLEQKRDHGTNMDS